MVDLRQLKARALVAGGCIRAMSATQSADQAGVAISAVNKQKPIKLSCAESLLTIGNQLLETPKYHPFKLEYEQTKKKLKRPPYWYSLFDGPKSIKQLAERLKHPVLYDVFFRHWSSSIHGTDIIQGKLSGNSNNQLEILQIRDHKNAQDATKN